VCLVHVFGLHIPAALRSTSPIVPLQVDDGSLPLKSRCRVNKGNPNTPSVKKASGAKTRSSQQTGRQRHIAQNTNVQHIQGSVRYITQIT
jgi:hypothetical protein